LRRSLADSVLAALTERPLEFGGRHYKRRTGRTPGRHLPQPQLGDAIMTEKSPITNPPNVLSFEKAYLFPSYF
jgi:hypothetical protein